MCAVLTSRYQGAFTSHSMSLSKTKASPARLKAKSYGIAHAAVEERERVVRLQPPHRRVHADARAVAEARIVERRQELTFPGVVPVRRRILVDRIVVDRRRADVGVVADEEHDRPIGRAADGVRAVIAHAVARVALDPLDRVHHVIAVGVFELVEPGDADPDRRPLIAAAAALGGAAGARVGRRIAGTTPRQFA